jgi:hypothetical protein
MSILPGGQKEKTPVASKRKSSKVDFGTLQPLKSSSTVKNFAGYRDSNAAKNSVLRKLDSKRKDSDVDSDMDDEQDDERTVQTTVEDADDDKDESESKKFLSPEDAERGQSLAEGVKKINLVSMLYPMLTTIYSFSLVEASGLSRAVTCPIPIAGNAKVSITSNHCRFHPRS